MQLATKGSTASYLKIIIIAIAICTGVRSYIAIHLKLAILYKILHLLASYLSQIAADEIHRVNFGGLQCNLPVKRGFLIK